MGNLFYFHPMGWVILGVAGYLVYQAGKKAGKDKAPEKKSDDSSVKSSD